MSRALMVGAIPALLLGSPAWAGSGWQPASLSAGIGYNADARHSAALEARWEINPDWQLATRLEHGFYTREHTVSLVKFDESFERNVIGLFAERALPMVAGLSLSAGITHADKASSWIAHPKADAVYPLNGRYYSGLNLGQPKADISYRDWVPYLGLHWSSNPANKPGWSLQADAGVFIGLDPQLRIRSDNPSGAPLLNADLQAEADAYVDRLKQQGKFLENNAARIGLNANYHF